MLLCINTIHQTLVNIQLLYKFCRVGFSMLFYKTLIVLCKPIQVVRCSVNPKQYIVSVMCHII
jgi:hypothetical protein